MRVNERREKDLGKREKRSDSFPFQDIIRLLGPRPWPETADWRSYLHAPKTEEKQTEENEKKKNEETAAIEDRKIESAEEKKA